MDSLIKHFRVWISAMRLRTLPLSLSGIILASCFAYYTAVFNWGVCILSILTTLSLQILSNFANDYGDGIKGTDNASRIGPKRAIQSGAIHPKVLLRAIKINGVISVILALLLIFCAFDTTYVLFSIFFIVLSLAATISAIRYTMGDNAYGYKGFGDLFVFVFFGLVSVIGCYVLYAKTIHGITFLPACGIGFLSAAVLNLNNMRDAVSDKLSGKNTLAVKMGQKNIKYYHYGLILLTMLVLTIHVILFYTSVYNIMFMICYVPLLKHLNIVAKNNEPELLDLELKKIALITFSMAILMGVSYII